MKKTFLRVLVAAAAGVALLCAQAVAVASHAADSIVATCRDFKKFLVASFLALTTPTPGQPEAVPFARAKAFVLRLAKRERPVVTASWRMCSSIG